MNISHKSSLPITVLRTSTSAMVPALALDCGLVIWLTEYDTSNTVPAPRPDLRGNLHFWSPHLCFYHCCGQSASSTRKRTMRSRPDSSLRRTKPRRTHGLGSDTQLSPAWINQTTQRDNLVQMIVLSHWVWGWGLGVVCYVVIDSSYKDQDIYQHQQWSWQATYS